MTDLVYSSGDTIDYPLPGLNHGRLRYVTAVYPPPYQDDTEQEEVIIDISWDESREDWTRWTPPAKSELIKSENCDYQKRIDTAYRASNNRSVVTARRWDDNCRKNPEVYSKKFYKKHALMGFTGRKHEVKE